MTTIPTSTQWTLKAIPDDIGREAINAVFMILGPKTKGTGFLLSNGYIVTNRHVINGCNETEIHAYSSLGNCINFSQIILDENRDLAILKPIQALANGFNLYTKDNIFFEEKLITWGYPLWHNDPSPLRSVHYLSGFRESKNPNSFGKILILNGAINGGNSGGPLLYNNEVVGVIVSKWYPVLTTLQESALKVFSENSSGVNFNGVDENGNRISLSESQLVAEIISGLWKSSQVMIGEAICASELKLFLQEKNIAI